MNNYQSYKDYKSEGGGKEKPLAKARPKVNRKPRPRAETLIKNQPRKKNKANTPSGKRKQEENKRKLEYEKKLLAEKKIIAAQNKKNLKKIKQFEKKEKIEQRRQAIKSNKKSLLIACFVVFYIGISMGILYNNSKIAQMQYNVNEIKKEIEKETNYNNELEAEREGTFKSETIENYAKYRLNMVYPSKEQTVYIKID